MKPRLWIGLCYLAVVAVGASAHEAPQQKIFVAGTDSDELYVINAADNTLAQTIKMSRPHGLAATKDGKFLWVASGWFGTPTSAAVTKINTVTGEIVETHSVPHNDAMALVNNDRDLYISGFPMGCYYVFDTVEKKVVAKFDVLGMAHNVVVPAHDDRLAYLSPMGSGDAEILPLANVLGGYTNCAGEREVPKRNHQIYVVDTRTRKIVDTIETGTAPRPIAVTDDGAWLYATVDGLVGFEVIDLKKRQVVQRIEAPLTESEKSMVSRSHGIAITPDQKEVWTNSVNHGVVFAYDRASWPVRFIARINVGQVPYWLTFSPDGKYAYSSNRGDDTVSVIDVATHKEVKRISLPKGSGPHTSLGVAVSR